MLKPFLTTLLASASAACGHGSILIGSHADISLNYSPSTSSWITELVYGDFENPDNRAAFDQGVFPLRDVSSDDDGPRYSAPGGAFDFLGVDAGRPVWIAPQADGGFAWPGIRNETPPGSLARYQENDPRVSDQGAQPWVKVDLLEVTYVGLGSNPQVSLWQSDEGGAPIVWAATSDGLDATDAYYQLANGHSHLNWGFTEKGIFELALQASAYRGPGKTRLTQSDVRGVRFAVGTFAIWKAEHFAGDDLLDQEATGPMADGDSDRVPLLLEYAFNLEPAKPDTHHLTPGTGSSGLPAVGLTGDGRLRIEYLRRKASTQPEIRYEAQFAAGIDAANWQAAANEAVTSIDDEWERVEATGPAASGSRQFGRVVVTREP